MSTLNLAAQQTHNNLYNQVRLVSWNQQQIYNQQQRIVQLMQQSMAQQQANVVTPERNAARLESPQNNGTASHPSASSTPSHPTSRSTDANPVSGTNNPYIPTVSTGTEINFGVEARRPEENDLPAIPYIPPAFPDSFKQLLLQHVQMYRLHKYERGCSKQGWGGSLQNRFSRRRMAYNLIVDKSAQFRGSEAHRLERAAEALHALIEYRQCNNVEPTIS